MTAAELARLLPCPCGAQPTAPLGEFCPDGDGTDLHEFPQLPADALPGTAPGESASAGPSQEARHG